MKYPLLLFALSALLGLWSCKDCALWEFDAVNPCDSGFTAAFTIEKDTLCTPPCEVTFIPVLNNSRYSYDWVFSDGVSITDSFSIKRVFNKIGPVVVTLTIEGDGCKDIYTDSLSIGQPDPVADFDIINNGCEANCTITFENKSQNVTPSTAYDWSFGDGAGTSVQESPSYEYKKQGVYKVRLIVKRGLDRDTIEKEVSINAVKFEKILSSFGPGRRIHQLTSGGYIILGNYFQGANAGDIYLLKTDAHGENPVSRSYSFSDSDNAEDLIVLSDGSYLIVGSTKNAANKTRDIFYLHTDSNLVPIKGPTIFGTDDGDDYANSVIQLSDGNLLVSGHSIKTADKSSDAYITKVNPDLTIFFWGGRYDIPNHESAAYGAIQLPNGFAVVGQTTPSGKTTPDAMFLRLNTSGQIQAGYPKTFGGNQGDYAYSIAKTPADTLMICGYTASAGAGLEDVYLIKTDKDGIAQAGFPKTIGTIASEYAQEVRPTSTNGFVVCGQKDNDGYFLVLDGAGMTLFEAPVSATGVEAFASGQQSADGGYVFAGDVDGSKLYFVKTDKDGKSH